MFKQQRSRDHLTPCIIYTIPLFLLSLLLLFHVFPLSPFTHHHLLFTCFSSAVTAPHEPLIQPCTLTHACLFFVYLFFFPPPASWIINDLYRDSLRRVVCRSGLTQSHPHTGPRASSLHVASHRSSLRQRASASSLRRPRLLSEPPGLGCVADPLVPFFIFFPSPYLPRGASIWRSAAEGRSGGGAASERADE